MGTRSGGLVPILVCAPIPFCRFFRQENEGVPHPCRDLCDRVGILTSRSAFKTKAPTLLYPVASAPSVVDVFSLPRLTLSIYAEHLCYTGTSSSQGGLHGRNQAPDFCQSHPLGSAVSLLRASRLRDRADPRPSSIFSRTLPKAIFAITSTPFS